MAYRAASRFAITVGVQAATIGALIFAASHIALHRHYYASALILIALALLIARWLVRTAFAADQLYADFADALAAASFDLPPARARHFPALADALRRASAQLSNSRQQQAKRIQELEALIDTVSAVLLLVRSDGQVVLANQAARTLTPAEIAVLGDIPAIGATTAARLMKLPAGAREIVQLAGGQRMLASVALLRDADGIPHRLISLQGLSSELAAVETKAWQDLVRILAHEMMNSLTPIVSMSDSLQTTLHPHSGEPDPQLLEQVAEAVDVIARRTSGLMSFVERYRRVAELPEPQYEAISAKALAGQLDRLAAAQFEGSDVVFRSRIEPPDLIILADADLLQQALINLIKNAAEAVADAPDPAVELVCRAADRQIVIEVSDNGRGLPKDDPEKIFTPFFTTKRGGSGIGLALARQIAVAHGGELIARGRPRGVTFGLTLPHR